MATTIKSSALNFANIKQSLKTHLDSSGEFNDYDFSASGISSLLDVLAYNTHLNGLTANFALNESFLSTAQLRSSIVGLASAIGYTIGSRVSSYGVVNLQVTDATAPAIKTMPTGTLFVGNTDGVSYTYRTREVLTATNDGSNNYLFVDSKGSSNIRIYEGTSKTKTFYVGTNSESEIYVIPDESLNLDTVEVRVYNSSSATTYSTYTNINNTTSITASTAVYLIREAPNGYYELTFANGSNLGITPPPGAKIEVIYLRSNGSAANGARIFTPSATLGGLTITSTTVSSSSGGLEKEGKESIRRNAPFLYATQNRMVTASDYAALSLRNFSSFIQNIKAWGGEDNIPAKYGSVYLSIDFFDGVSTENKLITKEDIVSLAKDLSVASFKVEFTDPVITYVEVSTRFQFNPKLTVLTKSAVETLVKNVISTYFSSNLGTFDKSFRRSNLLTKIDAADASILSSRLDIKMQQRIVPTTGVITNTTPATELYNYTLTFPAPLSVALDDAYVIRTSNFVYFGKSAYIRNAINTTKLQIIDLSSGSVLVDNIGNYVPDSGIVSIVGFKPSSYTGAYIRISAIPANPSVINPVRENILEHDAVVSTTLAVLTDTV